MEEAVVRIVLDSAGSGSAPTKSNTSSLQQPPPPPTQLQPTAPPRSDPIPVKPVDLPKPPPPPAAPPPSESTQPPLDWMKSLISPVEGANPHVLLEGQSGSGKSLAAKHIAFERMKQGQDVSVVDTHTPEAWGGAKNVFQGATAGTEAADFLRKELESRKEQKSASLAKGEQPDFNPMTVVFSDFARLMKDTPQLGVEFATLLTEARKFRISVVADTTALTGAASGIKGIQDVLQNFGQKVKFYAPTAQGDVRKAEVAGVLHETPKLPEYKERIDYSLIKPPAPPEPPKVEEPFDPLAVAKARIEKEKEIAEVDAEYAKLKPPEPLKPRGALDTLIKTVEPMRGAVGGMFGGLAGIALDTTAAMRKQASQTGGEDGGGTGKAAAALGGVALAGAAVVKTFSLLDGEVQKSISRYAEYSPDIAQAQAQADMKTILNDMRRAQEHGPEIARYIEAQAELQNKWEDAKMKFMEAVMPIMEELMKVVEIFIPLVQVAANLLPLIEVFIAKAHPILGAILIIAQIASWFRSREDTTNDDFFNFDPFTILTGGIGGAATPGGPQANTIFGGV